MPKRDRWDSSSDEEKESGRDKRAGSKRDARQTTAASASNAGAEHASSPKGTSPSAAAPPNSESARRPLHATLRRHNPLLEGCRSVYDTYERIQHISEGTYGIVWKAKDLATQEIVALKQIKFDFDHQSKQGFPLSALREISVLLALDHECIVTVKEMVVGSSNDKVFMVMEYMEMDLKDAMEKKRGYPDILRQSELKGIVKQILRGIEHMHSRWFLHRDVKPSNMLVHRSGRVALCDLGLARRYRDPLRAMTQTVATLWYRAPELLFGQNVYGPAIDMWSIGCVFGELICQETMMRGEGELDQINQIFSMVGTPNEASWPGFSKLPGARMFRWKENKDVKLRSKFPSNAPPHSHQTFLDGHGYDLLSRMLALDPAQRISAKEALGHPYFSEGVTSELPNFFHDDGADLDASDVDDSTSDSNTGVDTDNSL